MHTDLAFDFTRSTSPHLSKHEVLVAVFGVKIYPSYSKVMLGKH